MPEAMIGLEIHIELNTRTKMFCACENRFGALPNTLCCPVCLGLPGALPTVNQKAVELGVMAGIILHSEIQLCSGFDRKQYSYPDLPKAYQITQFFRPLCKGGYIELDDKKRIRIREMHLEEDAGKLIHDSAGTLIDMNRCGVPLLEIVTEPDISSPADARACMIRLKELLVANGISDGKLQEGSMRADVNVSVRSENGCPGERIELKNVSGFRAVEHAAEYEMERQKKFIAAGNTISRETRRWNEAKKCSELQRKKENLLDYRYCPEPDLPCLWLTSDFVKHLSLSIQKDPKEIREEIVCFWGCTKKDADYLYTHPSIADFANETVKRCSNRKAVLNWVLNDCMTNARQRIKSQSFPGENIPDSILKNPDEQTILSNFPSGDHLASVLSLIDENHISRENAQKALFISIDTKEPMQVIIDRQMLWKKEDDCLSCSQYKPIIEKMIDDHPLEVIAYQNGEKKLLSFFIGQALNLLSGASPKVVRQILLEYLDHSDHSS